MTEKHSNLKGCSAICAEMKKALDDRGFFTTWKDPVFGINRTYTASLADRDRPTRFYVLDLPVPEFYPYDPSIMKVEASGEHIDFSFIFQYCAAFLPCYDREDFDEMVEVEHRHNSKWVWVLVEYFADIECRFGLKWNFDMLYSEDILYGRFHVDQAGKIVEIVEAIRAMQL